MVKMEVTQENLQHVFYLDEDGELYSRLTGKTVEFNRHRYKAVSIGDVKYYSHRLIWLYVYGYLPRNIDHKDGNCYNNRIDNLREANMGENIANANFGPLRGVERHGAKYRARIWVDGVRVELGSYATLDEAIAAYEAGADKYFGEFAFHNRAA